jgi:O-antigen ligase
VLGILGAGLVASYVRTAFVVALALVGLALARRGKPVGAMFVLVGATVAAVIVLVVASEQPQQQAVAINPTTYLTLNGRTQLWKERIGNPQDWPLGQGVGVTGTAASRARASLSGKQPIGAAFKSTSVDSGYLTLISDVGIIGLVAFLAILGRSVVLARRAIAARIEDGWIVIAVVAVFAIDGLSREAFTAYPGAYLSWLLVGLGLAAAGETARNRAESLQL